jgi:hypothetical protein
MIRIAISAEAFEAIARTLPLGSMGFEPRPTSGAKSSSGLRTRWRIGSLSCGGRARATATLSYVSRGRRRLPLDAGKAKLSLGAG